MKVKVCMWNNCKSRFSEYILARLENDKNFNDLKNLEVEACTCLWVCEQWPAIEIDHKIETRQNPLKASEIVNKKPENEKN
jgi:NADH:ubiquinone oxidoreductase subunit E